MDVNGPGSKNEPIRIMYMVSIEEIEEILASDQFRELLADKIRPHVILSDGAGAPLERTLELLHDVFVKPSYDSPFES
jgi:hypothetical protein